MEEIGQFLLYGSSSFLVVFLPKLSAFHTVQKWRVERERIWTKMECAGWPVVVKNCIERDCVRGASIRLRRGVTPKRVQQSDVYAASPPRSLYTRFAQKCIYGMQRVFTRERIRSPFFWLGSVVWSSLVWSWATTRGLTSAVGWWQSIELCQNGNIFHLCA